MIRTSIFPNTRSLYKICIRFKSEPILNIEKLEEDASNILDVVDEGAMKREEEIQRKRNKSRLYKHHQNIVHGNNPHPEPKTWFHGTLAYSRKLYGCYGAQSGVDPSYCWPTQKELENKMEYERIAFPYTILEVAEEAKLKRIQKEEEIQARQQSIISKIEKLDQWKRDLKNKVVQKEKDATLAKQRKDRLIDEVRRHFGYTVDPRDEKFQQMLEKKEKEQKKISKEARKKEREARMMAALLSKKSDDTNQATIKPNSENNSKPDSGSVEQNQ